MRLLVVTLVMLTALCSSLADSMTMYQNTSTVTATNDTTNETSKGYRVNGGIEKNFKYRQEPSSTDNLGAHISDPMIISPFQLNLGVTIMRFIDVNVRGLSKICVKHLKFNLNDLQITAKLNIQNINVHGSYFLDTTSKPFNMTTTNVDTDVTMTMIINRNENLQVTETEVDVRLRNCAFIISTSDDYSKIVLMDMGGTVSSFACHTVQSSMRKAVGDYTKKMVNDHVLTLFGKGSVNSGQLPGTLALVVRDFLRQAGLDPCHVTTKLQHKSDPVNVTEWTVSGLSNVQAIDDVTLTLVDGPAFLASGTVTAGPVSGSLHWSYLMPNYTYIRDGVTDFTSTHIGVNVTVKQTLDPRVWPATDVLHVDADNTITHTNRQDAFDYLVPAVSSIVSSVIRDIIIRDFREVIQQALQNAFNNIHVDRAVHDSLRAFHCLTDN